MKTGLRWRFVNQSNPQETVLVHDEASARTLAALLQKMNDEWIMQEERSLGAGKKEQQVQMTAQPAPQQTFVQPLVQQAQPESFKAEEYEEHHEEESAEDQHEEHPMAAAVMEAVVQAAQQHVQAQAQESKVTPPPAPKKLEKQEKRERRSQPRYMTEFRVILISGSSSFRTMSQDVSLGGMRLKKSIPEAFMKEKCIAYVSHKDLRENIEIVCNVVGDTSDPCRIKFVSPNQTQLKRLNDWLLEHNPVTRGNKAAS
ncbi:MAG: PilZ domain-containing protein [Bdellovibrionales bacterium]|nr:PilZ domain-containing protein [Bdellovibrionales bacterium]